MFKNTENQLNRGREVIDSYFESEKAAAVGSLENIAQTHKAKYEVGKDIRTERFNARELRKHNSADRRSAYEVGRDVSRYTPSNEKPSTWEKVKDFANKTAIAAIMLATLGGGVYLANNTDIINGVLENLNPNQVIGVYDTNDSNYDTLWEISEASGVPLDHLAGKYHAASGHAGLQAGEFVTVYTGGKVSVEKQ